MIKSEIGVSHTGPKDEDSDNESDVGKMYTQLKNKKDTTKKTTFKEQTLRNPDVKRWYDNLERASVNTADVRLRRCNLTFRQHNMSMMEAIQMAQKSNKDACDFIQDHITMMEQEGKAPQYIKTTVTALKSWYAHFDIELKRKFLISNAESTPTLENERVPDVDEITELFNRATLRQGAIMSLMAKAGLRPGSISSVTADDGLKVKDFSDLAVIKGVAVFLRYPPMIIVRRNLSKTGKPFITFITDIGAKKILAYLNDRILQGDSLGPDDAIIAPLTKYTFYRGKNQGKKFVETSIIERDVRTAMRPRFNWRPYLLRHYWRTQMIIAESRGRVSHSFAEFWFGHTGDMSARYSTNKGMLPKALLDEMRDSFKRCEEFLDLEKTENNPLMKEKEEVKENIEKLTPKQLLAVQKLVSSF